MGAKTRFIIADYSFLIMASFREGSVVCNFKIRYILKESFVAVPFSIKPSNITNTLEQGFQFKKGILFQRFDIARGSLKASSKFGIFGIFGAW